MSAEDITPKRRYVRVPYNLEPSTLGEVRKRLITSQLGRFYGLAGEKAMTDLGLSDTEELDFSLLAQLPAIIRFEPETILFTAFSAIPLADLFRGTYQAIDGIEPPQMAAVHVSKIAPHTTHETAEAQSLGALLTDRRVAVVDQHVFSGASLMSGIRIAHYGDASAVLPVCGRWYNGMDHERIDTVGLTTQLARELQAMGGELARLAFKDGNGKL